VASAVRTAAEQLGELGARIREVEAPHAELYMAAEFAIMLSEASSYHQRQLRDSGDLYTEDVRTLLEVGELILATDYVKALRTRALIKDAWREMFDGLDAVLAPTLPTVASRVGQRVVCWPDGTEEEITS